ncbi:MAG TPA: hypothetical protein VN581_11035 [Patescibacteria group bacterium]|nr:hypothetical protein [Patescibacteria group bacterium]
MTLARDVLALATALMLSACADEAPPPQPAPPADRNFTATVDDRPVVGGTAMFECVIRPYGADHREQFLLTFTDDLAHTIQVGIDRGDETPGPRSIVNGMATTTGVAFGRPQEASAELTSIVPMPTGAVISGRFSVRFEVASLAPGMAAREPLRVKDGLFEQVECFDPVKASARTPN